MKVRFSMGLHRDPKGNGFNVLLVGAVPTHHDALEVRQWIEAALREKAGRITSPGGIILPASMTDAKGEGQ